MFIRIFSGLQSHLDPLGCEDDAKPNLFNNHRGRGGLPMAGVVGVGGNRHGGREWLLGGDCFKKFQIAFTEIKEVESKALDPGRSFSMDNLGRHS